MTHVEAIYTSGRGSRFDIPPSYLRNRAKESEIEEGLKSLLTFEQVRGARFLVDGCLLVDYAPGQFPTGIVIRPNGDDKRGQLARAERFLQRKFERTANADR